MGNSGLYLTKNCPNHAGFLITGVGFNEGPLNLFATLGSTYLNYYRPSSI